MKNNLNRKSGEDLRRGSTSDPPFLFFSPGNVAGQTVSLASQSTYDVPAHLDLRALPTLRVRTLLMVMVFSARDSDSTPARRTRLNVTSPTSPWSSRCHPGEHEKVHAEPLSIIKRMKKKPQRLFFVVPLQE